jgi:hypothetical protein
MEPGGMMRAWGGGGVWIGLRISTQGNQVISML